MKKTIVSIIAVLIIGMASTGFAAYSPYPDVPANHWAFDAVAMLTIEDIVGPYSDGTFRGDNNITRYEMAMWMANLVTKNTNAQSGGKNPFTDVLADHWAYNAVATLASNDIISSYKDDKFRGNSNITRYEMALWIANMLSKYANISPPGRGNPFTDLSPEHWAYNSVRLLAENGIVETYGDGTFRGDRNITRYEASMVLAKTLVTLEK